MFLLRDFAKILLKINDVNNVNEIVLIEYRWIILGVKHFTSTSYMWMIIIQWMSSLILGVVGMICIGSDNINKVVYIHQLEFSIFRERWVEDIWCVAGLEHAKSICQFRYINLLLLRVNRV